VTKPYTVKDLRDRLDAYPADAPIWVLDVHPDGVYGESFHVVNAYMDRFVQRATIIVQPLVRYVNESNEPDLDDRITGAKDELDRSEREGTHGR
jgi:hypothetical protein